MTIIGTICGKGVIDLTLRKSKAAQKEAAGSKKRKREDGEEENVDVNARVEKENQDDSYIIESSSHSINLTGPTSSKSTASTSLKAIEMVTLSETKDLIVPNIALCDNITINAQTNL
ncbi:uncharacterized protein RHIMIDRAFT_242026 [Rhizopus microsporus ATCC 52813]|uniref:Uncharacterized protein n=1 Tax=Rhizopus microsporus ATCC 52813 TaxID=1340429 RepID=A0A2G4SH29_RHIZD|nr:uncharacterized protein RHIMIDRAFT_242026 [Rhizopus microsporus ATCC 52813]PHZ08074.1 hypothetical protein RHIMIDRAFT_242026 [Rhizopus microsporus ATCC 52813]